MAVESRARPRFRHPWQGTFAGALRRTSIRVGTLGVVALVLANLQLPWRPTTLCALRGTIGIPCPLCGTTTAAVHIGQLDLLGALAANPFTVTVIALVATAPLTGIGRWWDTTLRGRSRALVCVSLFVAAEAWQLFRAEWLP